MCVRLRLHIHLYVTFTAIVLSDPLPCLKQCPIVVLWCTCQVEILHRFHSRWRTRSTCNSVKYWKDVTTTCHGIVHNVLIVLLPQHNCTNDIWYHCHCSNKLYFPSQNYLSVKRNKVSPPYPSYQNRRFCMETLALYKTQLHHVEHATTDRGWVVAHWVCSLSFVPISTRQNPHGANLPHITFWRWRQRQIGPGYHRAA